MNDIQENDLQAEVSEEIIESELNDNNEPADSSSIKDQSEESEEVNQESEEVEVVVSIGDEENETAEEQQQQAPEWVRDLRKQYREKEKQIKELQARLASVEKPKSTQLPPKPKAEDFDYDLDKYDAAMSSWYEQKKQYDIQQEEKKRAEENEKKEWQQKLDNYDKLKKELKVKDYEDAEFLAQEIFNVTQQGIVLEGAENPALIVYALGKNPKKAQKFAEITNPVKFAFAIAKLEKELKVDIKKPVPPPEKTIQGSGRNSSSIDSTLDRLRQEAEKTGDFSKVIKYKQQLRAKK